MGKISVYTYAPLSNHTVLKQPLWGLNSAFFQRRVRKLFSFLTICDNSVKVITAAVHSWGSMHENSMWFKSLSIHEPIQTPKVRDVYELIHFGMVNFWSLWKCWQSLALFNDDKCFCRYQWWHRLNNPRTITNIYSSIFNLLKIICGS